MADDHDYGFYGKGLDGYVHYRQAMQESEQAGRNRSPRPGQIPVNRDLTPEENRKARAYAIAVAIAVIAACIVIGLFLC